MKQKTHKGTAKRIKISGSGKLRREQAGKRHLNEGLSSTVSYTHLRAHET